MITARTLKRLTARAANGLRRLTGRQADIDYRRWYATWDLQRDHWTIVGPATQEEYQRLSTLKLQMLIDLGLTPDAKLLDVGCGTGILAQALQGFLGAHGVYHGADISPEAVAFCRSRFPADQFSFHVSDMTTLPALAERFDFIVFYSVFTHTYPYETALLLREAAGLLADDGIIFADVFTTPATDTSIGNRAAVEINVEYLPCLLEGSGLRAELIETQSRPGLGQRLFFKFTRIDPQPEPR